MCTVNKSVNTKKVWKLIECTSYLVFSATSFAACTRVNCTSRTFEEDVKMSPNNNGMVVSAEFLKFAEKREVKL